MKPCVAIVSYNRFDMLVELLASLKTMGSSISTIHVIDNNSSDERYLKLGQSSISGVTFHRLSENVGGTGGFKYATEIFLQSSDEYVLLIDDDVEIFTDTLLELIENNRKPELIQLRKLQSDNEEFNLLQSFDINTGMRHYYSQKTIPDNVKYSDIVNVISFEGIILSKRAAEKIVWPDINYFISDDDTLAGLILKEHGITFEISEKVVMRRRLKDGMPAPWKMRYIVRNHFLLFDDFHKILGKKFILRKKIRYLLFSIRRFTFMRRLGLSHWKNASLGLCSYFCKTKPFR